ncbi:MAG: hypothetical protein ACM37U_15035 [Gemmatimonas sp.]
MTAPVVPAGYRTDIFIRAYDNTHASLKPSAVAECWRGSATTASALMRVWTKSYVNNPIAENWTQFGANVQTGDLLAVPISWGDPPTDKPCWGVLGPAGVVVKNVDVPVSGAYTYAVAFPQRTYSYRGLNPQKEPAKDPLDPSFQAYLTALGQDTMLAVAAAFDAAGASAELFAAGAQCPDKVKAALDAGTLVDVIKKSTPTTFCADLAASLPQLKSGSNVVAWLVGGGLAVAAAVVAVKELRKGRRSR